MTPSISNMTHLSDGFDSSCVADCMVVIFCAKMGIKCGNWNFRGVIFGMNFVDKGVVHELHELREF